MVKDDRPRDRATSILRGVAAFLAAFSILGLAVRARRGPFDPNIWWLDLRIFPTAVQAAILLLLAAVLLHWSINPLGSPLRAACTIGLLAVAMAASLVNAVVFYHLLGSGQIHTAVPLPLSLMMAGLLGVILLGITRRPARLHGPTFAATIGSCAILMPLAQIMFRS